MRFLQVCEDCCNSCVGDVDRRGAHFFVAVHTDHAQQRQPVPRDTRELSNLWQPTFSRRNHHHYNKAPLPTIAFIVTPKCSGQVLVSFRLAATKEVRNQVAQ